jgi:hypothetical protein
MGTDRLGESAANALVSGGEKWWEWEVTSLVQRWLDGSLPNHGVMLLAAQTDKHAEVSIASKEYGWPAQLVVEYALR